MEAITEREVLIKLDSKVSQLSESIDRLTSMIEKIEDTKLKDFDTRLEHLEKKINEWGGVYKFVILLSILLAIFANLKPYIR